MTPTDIERLEIQLENDMEDGLISMADYLAEVRALDNRQRELDSYPSHWSFDDISDHEAGGYYR